MKAKQAFTAGKKNPKPDASLDRDLIPVNSESVETWENLTKTQKEICAYLARGVTNPQIAAAAKISIKTVERHRDNIYDAMAVHSIIELLIAVHGPCPVNPAILTRLSVREQDVCRLLIENYSENEIAGLLGISTKTACNHRDHIYRKLGLHNVKDLFLVCRYPEIYKTPELLPDTEIPENHIQQILDINAPGNTPE